MTANRVIAVDAASLIIATGDAPEIYRSTDAVVHLEDATPLEIVSSTGPTVADPTRSFFQTATIGIRTDFYVSWTKAPQRLRRLCRQRWLVSVMGDATELPAGSWMMMAGGEEGADEPGAEVRRRETETRAKAAEILARPGPDPTEMEQRRRADRISQIMEQRDTTPQQLRGNALAVPAVAEMDALAAAVGDATGRLEARIAAIESALPKPRHGVAAPTRRTA